MLAQILRAAAGLPRAAVPPVSIDYPADGAIFPPEITAPTFLWRDGPHRKALEIHPGRAEFHANLGVAPAWRGEPDEAVAQFRQALQADPAYVEAHHGLGDACCHLRRNAPAAPAHCREALRLRPDHLGVLNRTAWLLAASPEAAIRNGPEAVERAQRAARLSGGREPDAPGTLAAAYAQAGRFSDALETSRRALALANWRKNGSLAGELTAGMAFYERGVPFREPPPAASPGPR